MLTRNGIWVIAMVNTSAGSKGSRRRHGEENGSPTLPRGVAWAELTAELTTGLLLDRARGDLLALADRVGVLCRAGDHAREQLRAPVADVLELRDTDVLHTR